jgi:hypothetical protein
VAFIDQTLAFDNEGKCMEWLAAFGLSYNDEKNVDCKNSVNALANF